MSLYGHMWVILLSTISTVGGVLAISSIVLYASIKVKKVYKGV